MLNNNNVQTQINLIIIIIIIMMIVSLNNNFVKSQNSVNKIYESCKATTQDVTCGSQKIEYPFFINGQQQPYCGHPNFQLSCDSATEGPPALNISGDSYTVQGIHYVNRTIVVSNAALTLSGNRYGTCIPPLQNFTLPAASALSLRPNQRRVFLLYGCQNTVRVSGGGSVSTCKHNSHSVLALSDDYESQLTQISANCGGVAAVEAPARDLGSDNNLTEALKRGFVLDWSAELSVSCGDCERGGGICGSNDASAFECYCRDGPSSEGGCGDHIVSPAPAPFRRGIAAPGPSLGPPPHGETIPLVVSTGVPIGTIVAILIISAVLLCCLRRKRRNRTKQQVLSKLKELGSLITLYSYSDIKKMTNRFNDKIGSGGYGHVYKGSVRVNDANRTLVAVKVMKPPKTKHVLGQNRPRDSDQGLDSFVREVAAVSSASHVNVVKLVGFCYETGLWFESTNRALVFEFMENGSLDKYLRRDDSRLRELGLEKRYQIAIGIAKGLHYLHEHCNTRMVHFDIKPENILLDEKFVPKISDFGLAKTFHEDSNQVPVSNHRGTVGFMAPELCNIDSEGSHKCDVYSYGMMVIDILNLRYNPNSTNYDAHFPDWVEDRLESLRTKLSVSVVEDRENVSKEMKLLLVSLKCIENEAAARPTMSQVISMLEMGAADYCSSDGSANRRLSVTRSSRPTLVVPDAHTQ